MLTYRFVLRNDGGRRVEGLGSMGLTGDDEALAFGQRQILGSSQKLRADAARKRDGDEPPDAA
jgi:hypothetical protein